VAPSSVTILIDFAMFLYRFLKDTTRAGQQLETAMNSPDFNSSYYPLLRRYPLLVLFYFVLLVHPFLIFDAY
jgi:hypothetical protein